MSDETETKRMGDSTLRNLLAADVPTARVGPAETAEAGGLTERPGDFIGRYKLLEKIGEGGFGAVWRAEQSEPIRREVALKVIKAGMDSAVIIARFGAERQALARMDHPNIAAVIDAGTAEGGRPFFAMELVKGVPITEYADTHKLTIRQRLELFIPVCQAVQHAHQKAILHRDLKPTNILVMEVDGKPVPKVIDFGIAKALGTSAGDALEESLHLTQTGAFIGTPRYMSPEQAGAGADMDTRSDIYTLGVILYELLTGDTPLPREALRQAALHEVLRMIRESEPSRPSSRIGTAKDTTRATSTARATEPSKLNRTLRGDLDWITLKALEKERERRYGSAAALAQDLQRHLDSEPVEASPPSTIYRFRKLIVRNKVVFASATILLLILTASSFLLWRSQQTALAGKMRAERARDAAEGLVSQAVFDLRIKLLPIGKISLLEDLATAAEDYYSKLPPELTSSLTRRHQAWLSINRMIIAINTGDDDAVEASADKAIASLKALRKENPRDLRLLEDQYFALAGLAQLRFNQHRPNETVSIARELQAIADEWLSQEPDSIPGLKIKLAGSCTQLVTLEGSPMAAFVLLLACENLSKRIKNLGGDTIETKLLDGVTKYGRARIALQKGDRAGALILMKEAATSYKNTIHSEGGHPFLQNMMMCMQRESLDFTEDAARESGSKSELASIRLELGELAAIWASMLEGDPKHLEWWAEYSQTALQIGTFEMKEGNLQGGEKWYLTSLDAIERSNSPHYHRLGVVVQRSRIRVLLADCMLSLKRDDSEKRAAAYAREAFEIIIPSDTVDPLFVFAEKEANPLIWDVLEIGARLHHQAVHPKGGPPSATDELLDVISGRLASLKSAEPEIWVSALRFFRELLPSMDARGLGAKWKFEAHAEKCFAGALRQHSDNPDLIAERLVWLPVLTRALLNDLPGSEKALAAGQLEQQIGWAGDALEFLKKQVARDTEAEQLMLRCVLHLLGSRVQLMRGEGRLAEQAARDAMETSKAIDGAKVDMASVHHMEQQCWQALSAALQTKGDAPGADEALAQSAKLQHMLQSPPVCFRYDYRFDDPGFREWSRSGTSWTETPPTGTAKHFTTAARASFDGSQGTIIQLEENPAFEVFVTDYGDSKPQIFFRTNGKNWIRLGKIESAEPEL